MGDPGRPQAGEHGDVGPRPEPHQLQRHPRRLRPEGKHRRAVAPAPHRASPTTRVRPEGARHVHGGPMVSRFSESTTTRRSRASLIRRIRLQADGSGAGHRLYKENVLDHEELFQILDERRGRWCSTYDDSSAVRDLVRRYGLRAESRPMRSNHGRKYELISGPDLSWLPGADIFQVETNPKYSPNMTTKYDTLQAPAPRMLSRIVAMCERVQNPEGRGRLTDIPLAYSRWAYLRRYSPP
jgi:hypothetical protein